MAGTEKGVNTAQPTFSTCFGKPFMTRRPEVYGALLRDKIARHGSHCWLVNTGWTGGAYGTGARMPIKATRALLSAALSGALNIHNRGRVEVPVGVAYGSDPERVRQILLEVAAANSQIAHRPPPFVMFKDFGDSALVFELRCYLYDIGQIIVVSTDLRFAIDKAFRERGIQIPFPQRDLHIKDIENLSVAASHVDQDPGAATNAQPTSSAAGDSPPTPGKVDPKGSG